MASKKYKTKNDKTDWQIEQAKKLKALGFGTLEEYRMFQRQTKWF